MEWILTENPSRLHKNKNKQKLQILQALYIKINKPSLNKINFEYSSNILKCLDTLPANSFSYLV